MEEVYDDDIQILLRCIMMVILSLPHNELFRLILNFMRRGYDIMNSYQLDDAYKIMEIEYLDKNLLMFEMKVLPNLKYLGMYIY